MSFEEFSASLSAASPPDGLSRPLQALWLDAHGQWEAAHLAAQEDHGKNGAWVHAYLHRKEGDPGNAGYWYGRAGRRPPPDTLTLDAEWAAMARELLMDPGKTPPRVT